MRYAMQVFPYGSQMFYQVWDTQTNRRIGPAYVDEKESAEAYLGYLNKDPRHNRKGGFRKRWQCRRNPVNTLMPA